MSNTKGQMFTLTRPSRKLMEGLAVKKIGRVKFFSRIAWVDVDDPCNFYKLYKLNEHLKYNDSTRTPDNNIQETGGKSPASES